MVERQPRLQIIAFLSLLGPKGGEFQQVNAKVKIIRHKEI